MAVLTAKQVWRNYVTDRIPSSGNHDVVKSDVRTLLTDYEAQLAAIATEANFQGEWDASTGTFPGSGTAAKGDSYLVTTAGTVDGQFFAIGDKIVALINNASTSTYDANWGRIPANARSFVQATDAGAGTADAIQVTTDDVVADGTLVVFTPFENTTSSPVTLSINGGTDLTIKTPRGTNASGLTTTQAVYVEIVETASEARMLNDQDISALVAQAEAALNAMIEKVVGAYANDTAVDSYLTTEGLTKGPGTLYFNTTSNAFRYWNGSAWQDIPYATIVDGAVTEAKLATALAQRLLRKNVTKTANYTVTDADNNSIIFCDASAGAFTVTLPAVAGTADSEFRIRILKTDRSGNKVTIAAASGERLGHDGPQVNITGAADNGSGNVRLTTDEQRWAVSGSKVEIADVVGTTEANGVHTTTNIDSLSQVDINVAFVNAYVSGGTMTFVRESLPLRTQDSYIELQNTGSRWAIIGGTMDVMLVRDVLLGQNASYTGFDQNNNTLNVVDWLYDAAKRRMHLRSLLLTEVDDPSELGLRRVRGTYPDNISGGLAAGDNIGLVHFTGAKDDGYFASRSGQMYCRATETISDTAAGGRLVFGTTPNGTAAGSIDRMWIQQDGKFDIAAELSDGRLNCQVDTEIGMSIKATNASYTEKLFRLNTSRANSADYYYILAQSSNGGDTEFSVRGDGAVASDSGTAMSSPADYAEMVREWWDGNPDNEDRVGVSVVLVDKNDVDVAVMPGDDEHDDCLIRFAADFPELDREAIIGVISGNPAVKGGAAWNYWILKYKRDAFGRTLREEIETVSWIDIEVVDVDKKGNQTLQERPHSYFVDEVPETVSVPETAVYQTATRKVLNPEYNGEMGYIPREERKEWDYVGLLGRLPLKAGQPRHPRWIKLGNIRDDITEWLVR